VSDFDIKSIKGFLFDLDGVCYIGRNPIPGAADAVLSLKQDRIPVRFCTNTTVLSNESFQKKLNGLGLPIEPGEIFGAISAAQAYLRALGSPRCYILLTDDPKQDFVEFPQDDRNPEIVLVGDVCKAWSYDLMHRVFLQIMNGARLVALHKGRYWQTEEGLRMDIGAFVAGLEYVTGRTATIIGKPSAEFFRLAIADMGLRPEEVAMVGDDINSDIGGAQATGMRGILVRTGKYRPELVERSSITPDLIIDSVVDLPGLLG